MKLLMLKIFRAGRLNSIRSQIILHFSILFVFILGGISLAFYQYSATAITKEILGYSTQLVDLKRQTIDFFFSRIENNLRTISSNDTVISMMKDKHQKDYARSLSYDRRISEFLLGIQKFHSEIRDVILLDEQGYPRFFTNNSIRSEWDFDQEEWFPEMNSSFSHIRFIGIHPHKYYYLDEPDKDNIISAVIPIIDYMNPERTHLGTVLCNLNLDNIEALQIPWGMAAKSSLLILDEKKKLIYSSLADFDHGSFYQELADSIGDERKGHFFIEQKYLQMAAVYSTSSFTNWKIIVLSPTEELLDYLNNIRKFTIAIMIIGFLSVVFISIIISRSISAPLFRLMNKMEKVEKGDFDLKLTDSSYIEIEKLSNRIELMVDRINKLNHDVFSWELTNKDAEIRALQGQTNPHFLFNTLQLIKSLAICGENEAMNQVVTIMGNILRYATYSTGRFVTIHQELKHVQEYMQIQDFRYPGKFILSLDCPESLYTCQVPKFILQPIVENSICHGFNETKKGNILISVNEDAANIKIMVKDDGEGIKPEALKRITEHLENHLETDGSKSIGLKNVYDRIRLRYGYPYGLRIQSMVKENCTVLLTIPKQGEPRREGSIY